jgi:hypothetical protein
LSLLLYNKYSQVSLAFLFEILYNKYYMNELETQIAKIQFGNPKATTTHVFVMAEQAFNGRSELYLITELPVFNPAALDECDRIANALAASLRRSYRKITTPETFESSLAALNEELGKLTSQGKTHWIGKLNALVAVKDGARFSIASTGKVTALLYRDDEFNNITEPSATTNVLKTFENFSVGKLHLGDIIILSTNQLFSNISADRIKNILNSHTLPLAGQEILRILQENTGPETAFGSLLGLMVEPGATAIEHVALADYVPPAKMHKQMAIQTLQTGKLAIQKGWESTRARYAGSCPGVPRATAGPAPNCGEPCRDPHHARPAALTAAARPTSPRARAPPRAPASAT